ncbi:DUF6428 family protein [Microvirga sp. CF3016]|uniref:DUF6428 family protein n=1 Tax=Microvirga sp. CF3016 TaxID=3110181 RepID=UPI002E79D545|nr:DUF6428 family protein [Microvirga sp. CF3016]MEE1612687.1 DUF6428 family protein [Microvirga sp. CF3016]
MTALASTLIPAKAQPAALTISDPPTGAFLDSLRPYGALPLVIAYAGRETRAGYHVTELKAGRFSGLDCGANPEAWTETFIQVWDVPGELQSRMMTVGKFLAIMDKVARDVGLDPASRLTFECGDDLGVIGLYAVDAIAVEPERVLVSLAPRHASCKPRDRWFEDNGIEKPVRLTEDDALAEKAIRDAVSGCCSTGKFPSTAKCC